VVGDEEGGISGDGNNVTDNLSVTFAKDTAEKAEVTEQGVHLWTYIKKSTINEF
jgi:hypothetical protein